MFFESKTAFRLVTLKCIFESGKLDKDFVIDADEIRFALSIGNVHTFAFIRATEIK